MPEKVEVGVMVEAPADGGAGNPLVSATPGARMPLVLGQELRGARGARLGGEIGGLGLRPRPIGIEERPGLHLRLERSDAVEASADQRLRGDLAAGDGGFGGPRGSSAPPHRLPERRPDMTQTFETRPDQALLFRLSAGIVPVGEPVDANRDGLPGPILPGLCLQGIACHAILKVICEYDHTLIRSFAISYAGPAYSGENLVADLWQDANIVSCRLRALARDAVVLDQGRCVLAT